MTGSIILLLIRTTTYRGEMQKIAIDVQEVNKLDKINWHPLERLVNRNF
jgi:hypothetical protein